MSAFLLGAALVGGASLLFLVAAILVYRQTN
jgi:hypothetical protein